MIRAAYLTEENAQWVANAIAHLAKSGDRYFELRVVDLSETHHYVLWVGPQPNTSTTTTLADGQEIVRYVTDGGYVLDLLLGKPDERAIQPAGVIPGFDLTSYPQAADK